MIKALHSTAKIKGLKIPKVGMLFILLLCITCQALGQRKLPLEYQVKAAFLFNFTKFITWPTTAFKSVDAPFVIGIIGDDPFGPYLDELVKDEKVEAHPIIVKRYTDVNDVTGCHLLFVNSAPAIQKQIISNTATLSTLTVSDAIGFAQHGGNISFFKQDNKVRLEINIAAAKSARLDISSKLLNIAKLHNN
ncbi:YfiR family protein [Mucilaginibacter antarcticus]|uniref:YfiR family protein n=1 Tax=Mucilaginibacter antarcticus TaxID=1855725 RepID=A0ABW5XMC0_9SPHI